MVSKLTLISILFSELLVGWPALEDISFKWKYVDQFATEVEVPVFGQSLRELEGKEFTLSGYYMPTGTNSDVIILSRVPYASCFFCGGAGMESVVEVHFKDKQRRFKMDEIVKVTGRLKLNDTDFDHLIFIIENAREEKES